MYYVPTLVHADKLASVCEVIEKLCTKELNFIKSIYKNCKSSARYNRIYNTTTEKNRSSFKLTPVKATWTLKYLPATIEKYDFTL